MQVEKRIVPFKSRSPSQPVSISVPITGIIPTSTIPCMGTATPSTTTAAACGHPLCLGSITVRGTFWWHNLPMGAVFPMGGCLAGWRRYGQPALLTLVVAYRSLALFHPSSVLTCMEMAVSCTWLPFTAAPLEFLSPFSA